MPDPTPEQIAMAKQASGGASYRCKHLEAGFCYTCMVRRIADAIVTDAQTSSAVAHDIIFAIRCELEHPSPSMDKIREHLNQWEMRR